MARLQRQMKFLTHIFYIIAFSYFITLQSFTYEKLHQVDRYQPDMKHVLLWSTLPGLKHEGQKHFIEKKCKVLNCYFTSNRSLFKDIRYFDAIVFNLQEVSARADDLPEVRGGNQKYIFAANDSADNYPVCDKAYDRFFNWTWTYRRDSTVPYKFFSVYNIENQDLGHYFRWRENMDPLTAVQKNQISSKYKIAATFMDTCRSRSRREDLLDNLEIELSTKYNLSIDVYGDCGNMKCKRKTYKPCYYRLRKNYFFFLAFEESVSKDFITDLILHAYKNDVVPVVYGGAAYEKFLPPNSYLDVKTFPNVSSLAEKMVSVMKSKSAFYEYFRWKNHYFIEQGSVLDHCLLCELLNTPSMLTTGFTYTEFRKWWNPDFEARC